MTLAGNSIKDPVRTSELLAISLMLSTAWIGIHLREISAKKALDKQTIIATIRQKWIVLNVIYVICLVSYIGWFTPIVKAGENILLWVMLGFLVFDILSSQFSESKS